MDDFVRKATAGDCGAIMSLIEELSVFEGMPEQVKINRQTLVQDGFEENPPLFHAFVVEVENCVVGYALYFYAYSTHEGGQYLYLEDLYMSEKHRGQGLGKKLLCAVVNEAKETKVPFMQWCVLNWNKTALGFYDSIGAFDLTKRDGVHMYRLNIK